MVSNRARNQNSENGNEIKVSGFLNINIIINTCKNKDVDEY